MLMKHFNNYIELKKKNFLILNTKFFKQFWANTRKVDFQNFIHILGVMKILLKNKRTL